MQKRSKVFDSPRLFRTVLLSALIAGIFFAAPVAFARYNSVFWYHSYTGEHNRWELYNGNYQNNSSLANHSSLPIVAVGDITRDGSPELVCRTADGLNKFRPTSYQWGYWYWNDPVLMQPMSDTSWEIVGTGHFDGATDNSADLVWRNRTTGDNAIWFMDGTRLISSVLVQDVLDTNWKIGAVGDFNNDDYPDLVWRHSTNGLNFVWYMQGANLISTAQLPTQTDTNWVIVGASHFNSDNKVDLLWRNYQTGDNGIWFMNGTVLSSTQMLPWSDTSWKVGGAGDYRLDIDGDSLPDLWERRYFSNLSQTSSGDPDGDGYSNSSELGMGTDPTVNQNQLNIGEVLDNKSLSWSSGGSGNMGRDTQNYTVGYGSMYLSTWSNSQRYVTTTVTGPGTVLFNWKVSSESGHDLLKFYIDGVLQTYISGEFPWHTRRIAIGSGSHTLKWEYSMDGSGYAGSDQGWVDHVVYYPAGNGSTTVNGALDNTAISWSTHSDWTGQTNVYHIDGGGDAVQAVPGTPGSYIQGTVTGPGIFTFYWAAQLESTISLSLDGNWIQQANSTWPGQWDWVTLDIPWGNHTVKFSFSHNSGYYGDPQVLVDKAILLSDVDADGMPDQWEQQYFGGYSAQAGTGDFDADGISNLQEYLNSTRPDVPELKVKITSLRPSSNLP